MGSDDPLLNSTSVINLVWGQAAWPHIAPHTRGDTFSSNHAPQAPVAEQATGVPPRVVAMVRNVSQTRLPTDDTATTITTAISAASRPYSTAVAPSSSRIKRLISEKILVYMAFSSKNGINNLTMAIGEPMPAEDVRLSSIHPCILIRK